MKDVTGENEFVGDFRNGVPDFGKAVTFEGILVCDIFFLTT